MNNMSGSRLGKALVFVWVLLASAPALGQGWPEVIELRQGSEERHLDIGVLREQADVAFTFHDPYLGEDIAIRGVELGEWARQAFGEKVERITITAVDGFEVNFDALPDPRWVLVTHHDGEPIGLGEKGPLRLVERHYGDRDLENLRNFNDWIWMIQRIEGAP